MLKLNHIAFSASLSHQLVGGVVMLRPIYAAKSKSGSSVCFTITSPGISRNNKTKQNALLIRFCV